MRRAIAFFMDCWTRLAALLLVGCTTVVGEPDGDIGTLVHEGPIPIPHAQLLAFDADGLLARVDPVDGMVLARASPPEPRFVEGPPIDVTASPRAAYVVRGRGTERRIDVHPMAGDGFAPPSLLAEWHGEVRVQALPVGLLAFRGDDAADFWLALDAGGRVSARYEREMPSAWWLDGDALYAVVGEGMALIRASLAASGDALASIAEIDMGGARCVAPHPDGFVGAHVDGGALWLRLHDATGQPSTGQGFELRIGEVEQVVAASYRPGRVAVLSSGPTQLTVVDVEGPPPWRHASLALDAEISGGGKTGVARREIVALPQGVFVASRQGMLRVRFREPSGRGAPWLEVDEGFPGEALRGPIIRAP